MKKIIYVVLVCALMLFMMITLVACADETVPLQERIDVLEAENTELAETLYALRAENDRIQSENTSTRNELNAILAMLEAEAQEQAQAEEAAAEQAAGAFLITYAGIPNRDRDMSWPYNSDLPLGLNRTLEELGEDVEIVWTSTNENIFTVTQNEDGTRATVTPRANGSARVMVAAGEHETYAWVRIGGMG